MHGSREFRFAGLGAAVALWVALSPAGLVAGNNNKNSNSSPPPAKPAAAPAKPAGGGPATVSRPAGGGAATGRPQTSNTSQPRRITTSNPGGHSPVANKPRGIPPTSPKPPNPRVSQRKFGDGKIVQRGPGGRVSEVKDPKRGMEIQHGLNASRRVSVERPNHGGVLAERGRPGYVQRGYMHNGHEYARRTYYYRGRSYARFYRGYYYRDAYMEVYAPGRYYPLGFYSWAYYPWSAPAFYSWGWAGSPWFGYYGFYFTPYATYADAPAWLTDYMVSSDLQEQYQAQQDGNLQQDQSAGNGNQPAPLTPEVKQMISDEVKAQLSLETSEAKQTANNQEPEPDSSGIDHLFRDGRKHVFVVGTPLDVMDSAGKECEISDGDAVEFTTAPASADTSVQLTVLSSKGGQECPKSDVVTVALADVQEMQNHMRETIDQGLQELQTKQGTGGLPAAPPSARAAATDAPIAKDAPPAETNGEADVNQQLAEADRAEKEVVAEEKQETAPASPAPAPAQPAASGTTTVTLGQSIEQVTASLGAPITIVNLGAKQIYKYKDMKITFRDGKVADVE